MPKIYPTNTNSFTTKDWLKATGGARFLSSLPDARSQSSGEIFTQTEFENALKKASAKVTVRNARMKRK